MKIYLTIALLVSALTVFSDVKDTTFNFDLNFDRSEESISCRFDYNSMEFTLRINNSRVSGSFNDAYDFDVEIIDINRNDNLREVLVKGYGNSDQSDMFFYQYSTDGKIIECGRLPSNFGIEVKGDGYLTEYAWMGFWTAHIKYDFNSREKTITRIDEEFYDVNQDCEVTKPFKLLADRDDNSGITVMLSPKTKLTIIKADISPMCQYDDGSDDNYSCDWYFFKTSDGKQGWCRLKDYQQNVDGLIWAG